MHPPGLELDLGAHTSVALTFKFKFKFIYSHLFNYDLTKMRDRKEVKNRIKLNITKEKVCSSQRSSQASLRTCCFNDLVDRLTCLIPSQRAGENEKLLVQKKNACTYPRRQDDEP